MVQNEDINNANDIILKNANELSWRIYCPWHLCSDCNLVINAA
jgi:hypothetical protein